MNILIINFEYPPLGGGGGIATRDFARELAKRHTVHVLTTWFSGQLPEETRDGVHLHRAKVWGRTALPTASLASMVLFVPAALLRGVQLLRQYQFTVINAQFVVPSGIPAAILSRLFHVPLVLSFIGGDIYDPTKGVSPHRYAILRALIRLISRQAISATAISEDTKHRAQQLHRVTLPITVTSLGITPTTVSPASRVELNLPPTGNLFVSIGRLIPRKGFGVLIRAWKHVPDAHLVIVGAGPLRAALEELRASLGLSARVHFMGYVSETTKLQILRQAFAYISAATHEGFGIVFLEAMAAGLPIIATNNGGHTDFLAPNINALLVPVDNEAALEAAIRQLQADGALASHLARANREKVQEYTIEKTARRFEEVLLTAVQQNKQLSNASEK